ncbi:MAG: TonB-dependent receptor, partial [Pseudomonadota bacterium]
VIIQENFQAVLTAFPNDTSRVQRVAGPGSPVTQINVGFVNASSVQTSGFDLDIRYDMETGVGQIQPFIEGTVVLDYDIEDPQAGEIDGVGRRNFSNFGNPTPEMRFNAGLGWASGGHSANLFARYISSYDDDQNCSDGSLPVGGTCASGFREIDSFVTIDAQYAFDTAQLFNMDNGPIFTLGVLNAAGEEPPQVFTNGGYDARVHDPRGRMLYARLKYTF